MLVDIVNFDCVWSHLGDSPQDVPTEDYLREEVNSERAVPSNGPGDKEAGGKAVWPACLHFLQGPVTIAAAAATDEADIRPQPLCLPSRGLVPLQESSSLPVPH